MCDYVDLIKSKSESLIVIIMRSRIKNLFILEKCSFPIYFDGWVFCLGLGFCMMRKVGEDEICLAVASDFRIFKD
jgi:hypothetical protein